MDSPWLIGFLILSSYLLGSIPFGVVVSRLLGAVDPRSAGSRNVGFTNVLRVSGKKAGILTLLGDIGKGWLAGWVGTMLLHQESAILWVALASVIGHLHSAFLRFKGGKGVATALGAALGVAPWIGLTLMGWRRIPVEIFVRRHTVRLCHVSNCGVAVSPVLDFHRVCLCRQPINLGKAQRQSGPVVVRRCKILTCRISQDLDYPRMYENFAQTVTGNWAN